MIKRILALGGISIAITFAQGGRGRGPVQPAAPGTAKERQLFAYDVTIDPNYKAPKTPWGEPDLQGIWPINHLITVPLERQQAVWRPPVHDRRGSRPKAKASRGGAHAAAFESGSPIPQADTSERAMRQLSLIVDPPDGQFPALTDYGKKLQAEMQSSYRPGQTVFDSVDDFAAWDRCITRGMPVSMEPRNYNNGIRIMQSPGYVVILLEMAHEARVIPTNSGPTNGMPPLASNIKEWMGESRGHWEGNTLVVETTNFNGLVGADQRRRPRLPRPAAAGNSEHEDHRMVHACRR